jgi:hypothetical protein
MNDNVYRRKHFLHFENILYIDVYNNIHNNNNNNNIVMEINASNAKQQAGEEKTKINFGSDTPKKAEIFV